MLAVLLIGYGTMACATAATPAQAMSAHLWINGLPDGQLVRVTVAGHAQLNYYGGQGRYDFPIAGQPGETIDVLADGKAVQSFAFEPGTAAYLDLTYADGAVTASSYDPAAPLPSAYMTAGNVPEPQTEHTALSLDGNWMIVLAIVLSLVVVGSFATIRRKGRKNIP